MQFRMKGTLYEVIKVDPPLSNAPWSTGRQILTVDAGSRLKIKPGYLFGETQIEEFFP